MYTIVNSVNPCILRTMTITNESAHRTESKNKIKLYLMRMLFNFKFN